MLSSVIITSLSEANEISDKDEIKQTFWISLNDVEDHLFLMLSMNGNKTI